MSFCSSPKRNSVAGAAATCIHLYGGLANCATPVLPNSRDSLPRAISPRRVTARNSLRTRALRSNARCVERVRDANRIAPYQQLRVVARSEQLGAQNVSRGCSRATSHHSTRAVERRALKRQQRPTWPRKVFPVCPSRPELRIFAQKSTISPAAKRAIRRSSPHGVGRQRAEIVLSRSIRAAAERGFDRLRRAQISRCRGAGNAQPKLRSATRARPKSLRRPPAAGAALVRRAPSCGGRSPAGDTSWPTYLSG